MEALLPPCSQDAYRKHGYHRLCRQTALLRRVRVAAPHAVRPRLKRLRPGQPPPRLETDTARTDWTPCLLVPRTYRTPGAPLQQTVYQMCVCDTPIGPEERVAQICDSAGQSSKCCCIQPEHLRLFAVTRRTVLERKRRRQRDADESRLFAIPDTQAQLEIIRAIQEQFGGAAHIAYGSLLQKHIAVA